METAAGVLLGILVGWLYVWSALQPADRWILATREPEGYYNLETAGFRSGHLYAAITPKPALLALADPYDPVANASHRVHDMSLFKGHYYLYFGVTPVVILFWPAAALTGWYVSEALAVALFCLGAIWTFMALVLAARRRYFPQAPTAVLIASWACLALATPAILLVEGPQFYQVPISCALFLQALMLAEIYRSIHSPSKALAWMGAAGLLFGLSLGARPNYLLSSVALLVPMGAYAFGRGAPRDGRLRALLKGSLAAFLPAAACGLGLLAFNWARFGSPAEFGMHYALAGERLNATRFISAGHLLQNLSLYLFNFGLWQSYFPFFSQQGIQPYGILRYLPWCWLAAAAFLQPRSGPGEERSRLTAFSLAVAGASVANLAVLASFFASAFRYSCDFAQAWLALAAVGALLLAHRRALAGKGRLAAAAIVLAAAVSVFFNLAAYAKWLPRKDALLGVARVANWPAYAVQRAGGAQFGGLRMELRAPEHPPRVPEPLFETGRQPDQRDWLLIEYLPAGRARLSLYHAGTGIFAGREFEIPPDRRLVVEARCGSLLPPFGHPAFSDWTREEYDAARMDVRVTVNGADVLRTALECYDSSPANMSIGRQRWFAGGMAAAFSGQIEAVSRLPLPRPDSVVGRLDKPLPIELSLYLPASMPTGADPLLVTGRGMKSDLLYCVYDGANRVRFALDHYGAGGPQSESIAFDPYVPHVVIAWMGSLASASPGPDRAAAGPNRLVVIFDGRTVLNVDQDFFPGAPGSAVVGLNAYGSTAASRQFTGIVTGVRQVGSDVIPRLVRSGFGAVEMSVVFPSWVPGTQEPLVVTGRSGAGDFVYVRYIDATHVSFGFDHWGVGGLKGPQVETDFARTHRIAISFQALYPADSASHATNAVKVVIDGRTALEGNFACHPSTADQITIGRNLIGGSTCGSVFLGRILSVERFPEPRK